MKFYFLPGLKGQPRRKRQQQIKQEIKQPSVDSNVSETRTFFKRKSVSTKPSNSFVFALNDLNRIA
jgi:hypothetical protein